MEEPPGPIEAASVGAVVDAVKKEPRAKGFSSTVAAQLEPL